MSERLLYQFETSPYCDKVKAVLAYKGLDYATRTVSPLTKKDLKFSKKKLVPILSDNGEIIEDSTDIVLYLEDKYPKPPLMPKEGPLREEILRWENWIDDHLPAVYQYITYTRPSNAKVRMRREALASEGETWEKFALGVAGPWMFPIMLAKKLKLASLHDLKDEVLRSLSHLEKHLQQQPYLAADAVSLADVALHGFVNSFRGLKGDDLFFDRPALKAWDDRTTAAMAKAGKKHTKAEKTTAKTN